MRRIHQTLAPRTCHVCGSAQLTTDEVENGRTLLLAECGRCDYRWTQWCEAFDAANAIGPEPCVVATACDDSFADAA